MSGDITVLAQRHFTLADQNSFAELSGDLNPIHVDPVAARRTIGGACIVHGVHGALWALEVLVATTGLAASSFKVRFLKPMFLNETVTLEWNAQACRLGLRAGTTLLATVVVKRGDVVPLDGPMTPVAAPLTAPQDPSFEDCAAAEPRPFVVRGNLQQAGQMFPALCAACGAATVHEMAALSQIVGMELPGLHSLFTGLKVSLQSPQGTPPNYRVAHSDARFKLLGLHVQGRGLNAEIEAFYRPAPVRNLAMAQLAPLVHAGEFSGVRALVIGGSRGLGELVAKTLVAGGGSATITYSVGRAEAAMVAEEVAAWGGDCSALQFTVGPSTPLPKDLPEFNQLYFFATPRIAPKRSQRFDEDRQAAYLDIYVHGFRMVCESLQERGLPCAVFYPSTVFIDSPAPEFENYVHAKLQGESLCQVLGQLELLKVITARLPRLPTDQTQAFTEGRFDDPVQVMLPWLRSMAKLVQPVLQ